MITFKIFKKLCEERQRGILYHYTTHENARSILNDNKLVPGGFDKNSPISFTRNKNLHKTSGRNHIRNGVRTNMSFEIDGDKLSNNRKIKPLNTLGRWHNTDSLLFVTNPKKKLQEKLKILKII